MIKNELVRQTLHVLIGTVLLILYATRLIEWWMLLILIIFSLLGLLIITTGMFPKLQTVFSLDRREKKHLPGYGALAMIGGFMLSMLIFPQEVAVPALIILVYGDSAATIIGYRYGTRSLPWNEKKTVQGTLGGIAIATIITAFAAPFWPVLLASSVALIVETLPMPHASLDDNLLLPLVAGIILSIII